MDGADVFYDYISKRLEHHKTRLVKISGYQAKEPSELNQDQRNALADSEKSEGKCEETEFLKLKYESQWPKRKEQLDKQLAAAREEGRLEAKADLANTLELVSSFLKSMSEQYKAGNTGSMQSSRESYAFYQLLAQFHAGGAQGAAAMQRFVDGDGSAVCDNGVRFADLRETFENPNWSASEPQPMQGPSDEEPVTGGSKSSEGASGPAAANGSAKYGKAWKSQAKPWANGKSWKKTKDAETEPKLDTDPESKAKPDLKTEAETQPRTDAKPETKTEASKEPRSAKPDLKPSLKEPKPLSPGTEPDSKKPESKLDPRPEMRPEGRSEDDRKADKKSPSRKASPGTETAADDFQVVGGAKERKPFRKNHSKKRHSRTIKSD